MNRTTKKVLPLLTLAILIAGGAGCAKLTTESPDVKETHGVEDDSISTIESSDWKKYRNDELGYQINVPDDWTSGHLESGDWIGVDKFSNVNLDLLIQVNKSELELEEYDREREHSVVLNAPKKRFVNELPAIYRETPIIFDQRDSEPFYTFNQEYIIKSGTTFYRLDFSSYSETAEQAETMMNIWQKVVNSFETV